MKSASYVVEYETGDVNKIPSNLLVEDVTDMTTIEYWEERLAALKQPFAIVFRKIKGKVLYSIFTDLKAKNSPFG